MNVEEFREFCLSLEGVTEKMPFANSRSWSNARDILCFYFSEKWFCLLHIDTFDSCCIKCNPDDSIKLQEQYLGITPGWHMNKKYWINVAFNEDIPDDKIKELVVNSYELVWKSSIAKKSKNSY